MLRLFAALALVSLGVTAAPAQQAAPRRAPAASKWVTTIVRTPAGGYRQGNPDAPVKLIEYGSRTCPTCARFAAEGMAPLRDQYIATGKVSYEYRDMLVHGGPDFALALLNQCVGPARFFTTLDAIYANQPAFEERVDAMVKASAKEMEAIQALAPAQMATRFAERLGFLKFMAARGLPEAQARKCLSDPALIKGIAQVHADGISKFDVHGTPSFFVNGRRVRAFTWDQLQPELWAAGA
ncbi:thioredoxin domain-containing protein [Sphingomonas sp. CJ20]